MLQVSIIISLTDITKYFDRNSKKRDVKCDNSNQEESSKKLKDGSLNTRRASDIPNKVFTESLKLPDCVNILFSCIKNVRQITQIFENTKELKEGLIKGEKHLAELVEVIDFILNKFEEYEKDRKEKEERIKTLEECLTNMSK